MNSLFGRAYRGTLISERVNELARYSELKRIVYNIESLQKQKPFRSLSVLSSLPSEGKTLFCAALAIGYAATFQSKVLVVDATTRQNPKSLILKDCLDPSNPLIDFVSIDESRQLSKVSTRSPQDFIANSIAIEAQSEVVHDTTLAVSGNLESDQSLIRRATADNPKRYGLILMDTAPLTLQNRNNIDPLLVAHLCDASVLVVSRKLLNASNLESCVSVLGDSTLRLIGMISNEDFSA